MTARSAVLILLAAVAATLGVALPAHAATYPAGFEQRTLIGGLTIPTGVAWTPDGRAIVIEKSGLVKVAAPGASTTSTLLDIRSRVNDNHDRGLLGVAVDSQFATHPYVYLLYTYELNPLAPDGGGEMVSQLLRIRLTADNQVTEQRVLLGSYTTGVCPAARNDLDCIPSDYDSHSIGTVLSAPDGTLYAGSGDAASYNSADRRALRSLDERSLAGKVVHIDREGRALTNHPFCPATTDPAAVCAKVHARGFRNPFRFALRPDGRTLVVGDVGWNTQEEIDLVGAGGKSYGWPCYEGGQQTPSYRDFNECKAEYQLAAGTHTAPDHQYCHCGAGASIMGGPTYTDDQYPATYRDTVFFADYSRGWIKRLELDAQGKVSAVRDFATSWGGAQLATAPNGDIAFVSFGTFAPGTGSVQAIRYVAGNRAPVARATTSASSGSAPLTVTLDARGSTDADGDALTYRWDFGDGTAQSTQANPTHTYTRPGTYIASVTVADSEGASDQASVTITAGDDAPVATIASPLDRSKFRAGAPVVLSGAGTDAQDGALPGSSLRWRIVLHHADHVHPLTELTGATPTFTARDDHDADSYYEITLTATDSGGLTGTRTIRIDPATVGLRLDSEPAGAVMTWAGRDETAPYASTTAIGFKTEVSAAPTLVSGGKTLAFARWSDGVTDRTRSVTVPESALTFTAVYEESRPKPVLALPFDSDAGTVARDASGRGNDGTVRGATWTADGRFGGSLRFDGIDDWVTVTDRADLDLGSAYTLSAWIRPETAASWQTVMMKETAGTFGYALYATSDDPAPSGWAASTALYAPSALPRNGWSHLTVTVGGGTQRLYVDGVEVASAPASGAFATSDPLRIGGNAVWNTEFFRGQIDEVRVYDAALTADQVRADRDAGIAGGTPPPPPPPPPSDAVAAWGFDETSGTLAHDASGNDHDGTVRGATWTTGRYGGGLTFDGIDDWVTIADAADLDLTSAYTLEAWVRPRSRASWQTILLKELGSTLSYALYATSDADVPSAWNGDRSAYASGSLPTAAWSHVAVSVGGGQQRLYVEGELVATSPATSAVDSTGPLRIGGNSIWTEFFDGTIDEVRVYRKALTQAEIQADRIDPITDGAAPYTGPAASYAFDDGTGTAAGDATGHGHAGVVSGASWATGGRHGGALRFDGTNDWVTVADDPALDLTGKWTLSAWVRPESTSPWQTVILKEHDPTLAYALYARSDADGPSGWTSFSSAYGPAALPLNTWSHLTATLDGGMMRLYVDGVQRSTITAVDSSVSTGPLRIGGNSVWGEWFAGLIDDVRIYDRGLTPAEVQADMNAGVTASTATARSTTARTASVPAARAAAARAPRRAGRGLQRTRKAALTRRVRRAAVARRAAVRRQQLTRRQKAAAVKRSLRRIKARRAAAKRRSARTPVVRSAPRQSQRRRR